MSETVLDVLVAGAGPAGVAAAIEARRMGLSALVVDKATFPRDKTCGDGLTTGALRLLDRLGFDVRALPSWAAVTDTVIVSPSGREVVLSLPPDGAFAGVAPRIELDAALVAHARSFGVEIREGCGVTAVAHSTDHVDVTLADGTQITARWVVAADGHYSPTRRMLGASPPVLGRSRKSWHAFRQYFHGVDDPRLWVLFEEDFLPGYAWVFPVGEGRANVGFGVLRTGDGSTNGKTLAAQARGLANRPSVRRALGRDAVAEGTARAWPIPADYDRARLTSGRVLFVGDAAQVVDPMTGEGIAQALESGMLATRAIATTPDDVGSVTERYRASVDRALGADLRFAAFLQHLLRVPLGARAAIATAALTPWTRRNFARWMWEDYPRALVLTPRRWRRGMFSAAGAYSLHSTDGDGAEAWPEARTP